MEPTQPGEEQPKEREKLPPADGGSGSTSETVAPSESTEIGKSSTEMKETAAHIPPEDDRLPDGMASLEKALQAMEEDSAEETFVIESSPEKQPSEKTKEDSLKSPGEEVFSIDDEEEAEERPVAEEEEDEEEEEEEEEDEEEEFEEMDEDEEIYVETTERVDANELSDENSSEPEISSDEYTDDEVDRVRAGARKGEKSMPAPDNRRACNEQDNDDGDVQILTDDDEVEEEEDNEPDEEDEEEDEEDDEDLDGTPEQETIVIRKFGLKYDSDSSESLVEKCPKLKVKYRNYQHKLAGVLRKRSFKIVLTTITTGNTMVVTGDIPSLSEVYRRAHRTMPLQLAGQIRKSTRP
uniref:Uncharacterized protein n=1 Tax=Anopheles atroparvus TaxID=41427 RepID=A0A182JBM0_ANOAO